MLSSTRPRSGDAFAKERHTDGIDMALVFAAEQAVATEL